MLGFGFDSKIPIALVGVVVADGYLHVDTDVCGCPAVSVGGMLHVNLSHNLDHLLPGRVPG